MADFVLHGIPGSPFVRSAQMGLEEKGARYRFEVVDPRQAKSAPYLELHPFGRVPAFAHGDFRLYETQAILRYLDDLFPEPPFEPADPQAAARMNQIVGINDWYFFPKAAAAIVGQRIVGPVLLGRPADETVVADAMPMARTCSAELNRLLGGNRFLAGDQFTLADIMLAPQIDFFAATPEGRSILKGTALEAWLARMNTRPSMIATQRPEPLRGAA
jgi:glutathione S-transferase